MADWGKILSRGDVEDRRGTGLAVGGGVSTLIVIAGIVYSLATGQSIDLAQLLSLLPTESTGQSSLSSDDFKGADNYEVFASTVLGSTNDFWKTKQTQYPEPRLVLFRQATSSGCGFATSDVGPHYCPSDQTIYLDETFFDELQNRFKAKGGDVAQAYVIAHEVGHHIQNVEDALRGDSSNQDSIKIELQADCYAGAWAHSISSAGVFEPNEINEALDAAAAVGDDRIQKSVNGQINPETWTHGSSEQRVSAFNQGYTSGDPNQCKS
jgi:predicted metalloprotease